MAHNWWAASFLLHAHEVGGLMEAASRVVARERESNRVEGTAAVAEDGLELTEVEVCIFWVDL